MCVCVWVRVCVRVRVRVCVCMNNQDSKAQDYSSTLLLNQVCAVGWRISGFSKLLMAPAIELFQGCGLIVKAHLEFLLNKAKK